MRDAREYTRPAGKAKENRRKTGVGSPGVSPRTPRFSTPCMVFGQMAYNGPVSRHLSAPPASWGVSGNSRPITSAYVRPEKFRRLRGRRPDGRPVRLRRRGRPGHIRFRARRRRQDGRARLYPAVRPGHVLRLRRIGRQPPFQRAVRGPVPDRRHPVRPGRLGRRQEGHVPGLRAGRPERQRGPRQLRGQRLPRPVVRRHVQGGSPKKRPSPPPRSSPPSSPR